MLKVLVVVALIVLLGATILPALGRWLGIRARKPFRQAKWMWTWFAGSEAESLEAERDYGRECAREFAEQFPGRPRPAAEQVVAEVGARLAAAARDSRREFVFRTVASPVVNAYALPGGFVFVTDSLIELCARDADETAFLLAHEMAHILCGHAKDKLTAGAFLDAVTARLPGAGQMLRQVLSQGYSRQLEYQADWQAVQLAAAAGFDRQAALRAFSRLAQAPPDAPVLAEYLSSHPPMPERMRELKRRLEA